MIDADELVAKCGSRESVFNLFIGEDLSVYGKDVLLKCMENSIKGKGKNYDFTIACILSYSNDSVEYASKHSEYDDKVIIFSPEEIIQLLYLSKNENANAAIGPLEAYLFCDQEPFSK